MPGIEQACVDERAGKECGLLWSEIECGLPEVCPRRSLGAVYAVAPLHDVEVELEDASFGQLCFEATSDEQLASFSNRVLGWREIEVLGELLGDRAGAAHELHALEVDL